MQATAIILAGGKSSRFGQDKTLYPVNGKTMPERTVDILQTLVEEILISTDRPGKFDLPGVREIPDIYRDIGPLGGIYSGLIAAKYKKCIIVAGDILQIDRKLTYRLLVAAQGYGACVPQRNGKLEPLYAVYGKELLPAVERRILSKDYSVQRLLMEERNRGNCVYYPLSGAEKKFFYNVNYPADIQKLEGS